MTFFYRVIVKRASKPGIIKAAFFIALFWRSQSLHAQNVPDSLLKKSDKELIVRFYNATVFEEKELYGQALIVKNKSEKDTLYLTGGYHAMALLYEDERALMYCDSIITLTAEKGDTYYPATAYFIKGNLYYTKRAYKNALDNYINANSYARKYTNTAFIFKSNYVIGILKDRIGEHEEALQLHRENFIYAKQNIKVMDTLDYLSSIFALANTFNELKILDSATVYNDYGIRESLRLKSRQNYHHFVLNSGTTHYYGAQYSSASDSIKKSLPYFEEVDDKPNMAVGYYYLGKAYFELGEDEKALLYLKKTDTVFQQSKNVLPKLREAYELLINYYKDQDDLKQQLTYVKQLMKLDSILYDDEIYLNKNIIKEYDIPRLIAEKENIITVLEKKESKAQFIIITISIGLLVTIGLLYYQYNRIKLYKKRAEALVYGKTVELHHKKESNSKKKAIGISDEIVAKILVALEEFEKSDDYLDSGISVHSLAKAMNTNANYLSRVVNHHKNLSFTHYINQLRITYAIKALKTNATYRRFTIDAIADEFGFNTGDSFSRAFYKYTGTRPSYFIKGLTTS